MESFLSEEEKLRLEVERLKNLVDAQNERHRIAIIAAENFLNFLRIAYGYDY